MQWVKEAWEEVIPNRIRESFKKCGITNLIDGTEDQLFNSDMEDEVSLEDLSSLCDSEG